LSFGYIFLSLKINQKFTVILDAGHGGKSRDSYHGFVEKRINLKTTLKLEKS
jgi:N-acetylmuramoyl-L-alanine amidase